MVKRVHKRSGILTNAAIAELLALEAQEAEGILGKALRRASRAAFLWPEEATEVLAGKRSLTELQGIGPFIEKLILRWLEKPSAVARPPPLRRNFLSLAQARRILKRTGFGWPKGDLQMHSTWSDGGGTILDMAQAGRELGYEYIAITDHSKGLKIAGGIDEAQLREQGLEIAAVSRQIAPFRVLHSIEMNLNPRGEGDMDRQALRELDLIVGSFHSQLRVKEDQTERYLAAIRNPDVHILGHPRGRIYNYRIGLKADWARVFAAAAKLDKAVEVDSYPDRQDLDIDLLKIARDSGVKLAIDTDAHSAGQLRFIEFGLAAAALAKFPVERIVNFMAAKELLGWVDSVRERHRVPRSRKRLRKALVRVV